MTAPPSLAFLDLYGRTGRSLAEVMREGRSPDPAGLAGNEFRGANIGPLAGLLGIRRFIKGFRADARTGYNVRVPGDDLEQPWTAGLWRGQREFGFYSVAPVQPGSRDSRHPQALLLDYGAFGHGFAPERLLRDYLVEVQEPCRLLLGEAFLATGPVRLPAGYFVLEPLDT